ncbi:MAG: hypothetical protein PCFJNLEI_02947 [Verrucomicrobiae bacterium]|nr:hypothetical protein [Verrucomicrobiae bacterium]
MNASCYPFNLDGPLCPLLNNKELLAEFYSEESLRHGIKNFCKKANWPGKPATSFAIDPAKLQELLLSLFNSPAGRKTLQASRATYLDNAIWQWLTVTNPKLAERVSLVCDDVKGRLFLKPEALVKLLQKEAAEVGLAYVVLAFAMLQPDDRQRLGEVFLAKFPDYAAKFGVV